jgi:predicted nucleotidyltransferase
VAHLPELDVRRILQVLTAHGVDFVVIGGMAAVLHGSATLTQDVDISFAQDDANLEALGGALRELQASLRGVEDDVPFVPAAGPLDVLVKPDGCPPYERLRRRADRMDVGGFAVLVASIDDLIAMKRAAGRDKDLLAVEELNAIRDLRSRGIGPSN